MPPPPRPLPVAEPWFDVRRLDDDITLIVEQHANEWLLSNSWHIRGTDRDVLIDTGLGVVSLRDLILSEVADREPVVLLTHAHLDHMGSAHEFAEVWAHAAEPVDVPGRGSLIGSELARILGLPALGEDPTPEALLQAVPYLGYDPASYVLKPTTVSRFVDDLDIIDLGNRNLQVLHLPGHTPGSIAIYDTDTRTLFSGDVVYDELLLDTAIGSDIDDYVQSMRRLQQLDVATVHAGHAGSFDGARLQVLIDEYLAWRAPN